MRQAESVWNYSELLEVAESETVGVLEVADPEIERVPEGEGVISCCATTFPLSKVPEKEGRGGGAELWICDR